MNEGARHSSKRQAISPTGCDEGTLITPNRNAAIIGETGYHNS